MNALKRLILPDLITADDLTEIVADYGCWLIGNSHAEKVMNLWDLQNDIVLKFIAKKYTAKLKGDWMEKVQAENYLQVYGIMKPTERNKITGPFEVSIFHKIPYYLIPCDIVDNWLVANAKNIQAATYFYPEKAMVIMSGREILFSFSDREMLEYEETDNPPEGFYFVNCNHKGCPFDKTYEIKEFTMHEYIVEGAPSLDDIMKNLYETNRN